MRIGRRLLVLRHTDIAVVGSFSLLVVKTGGNQAVHIDVGCLSGKRHDAGCGSGGQNGLTDRLEFHL